MKRDDAGAVRGDLLAAVALGALAAAVYALTWSGRYYHDGQFFIDKLEAGDLEHLHVAYLPVAWVVLKGLGLFGGASPESALNVLTLMSAAVSVGVAAWLAARMSGSRSAAVIGALVLLLAPSHWFSGVIAEIHVFTSAAAALGAAIAWHGLGGRFLAPLLATAVAMAGHLTCGALFPAFGVLAIAGRLRRDGEIHWVAAGVATLVAAAPLFFVPYLTVRTHGAIAEERGGVATALVGFLQALVADPVGSLHELRLRFIEPWALCAAGPLLLLVRLRASIRAAGVWTLLALALAFGGILVPTLRMSWIHGMYIAPLAPFCAIALAIPLATLTSGVLRVVGVVLVLVQAALGIAGPVGYRSFAPDVDKEWAGAAAAYLEPTDLVFLQDNRRRKRLLQVTDATVHYLLAPPYPPPAQLAEMARKAARGAQASGRRFFLDPWLFEPDCPLVVVEAARSLEKALRFEAVPGAPLLRVVGVID